MGAFAHLSPGWAANVDTVRIAVAQEITPGELRVAATPDSVSQLLRAGYEVVVQSGAGAAAHFPDQAYRMVGATVVSSVPASTVDVLLHVQAPHPAIPVRMRPGACAVGFMDPARNPKSVEALATSTMNSFALDLLPAEFAGTPIGAATTQDVVSGYRAALEALHHFGGIVGTTVTAATAIAAAKVLIVGAGVSGLQAADTFRRLGAKVTIADPAPSAARDAAAVKASFVEVPRITDPECAIKQRDHVAPFVADADIVVAAVPSQISDPIAVITQGMVTGMRPGSVVVDLGQAHQLHTNVSEPDAVAHVELAAGGHVTVLSMTQPACSGPKVASEVLSKSITRFILDHTEDGEFVPDLTHPACVGSLLTHDGHVVHHDWVTEFSDLTAPRESAAQVVEQPEQIDLAEAEQALEAEHAKETQQADDTEDTPESKKVSS